MSVKAWPRPSSSNGHVKPGDAVREDMVLAAVMTDKATVVDSSPVSGTVTWIAGEIGDIIAVEGAAGEARCRWRRQPGRLPSLSRRRLRPRVILWHRTRQWPKSACWSPNRQRWRHRRLCSPQRASPSAARAAKRSRWPRPPCVAGRRMQASTSGRSTAAAPPGGSRMRIRRLCHGRCAGAGARGFGPQDHDRGDQGHRPASPHRREDDAGGLAHSRTSPMWRRSTLPISRTCARR